MSRGACCSGASYPLPEFDASELLKNAVSLVDMSAPTVYLKNTHSGVVEEFSAKTAKRYLEHPDYSKFLVVVDSTKNEVLAQPYTIDEEGTRAPVEANVEPVKAPKESK